MNKEFIHREHRFLAKTLMGLEEVLADELRALGAKHVEPAKRGVFFSGNKELLYKANYSLYTAIRILVPIHEFNARNEKELYHGIQSLEWDQIFTAKNSFLISATVFSDNFNHSHYVALKSKDAIVDQFREKYKIRPSIDNKHPDYLINIHISGNKVTVSLDSSGESLHIRGYRKDAKEAPISEVLAAGLVRLSGWKPGTPLVDFMCGSGTILSEAALWAFGISPGKFRRKFGFALWQNFDEELFTRIRHEALQKENKDYDGFIGGCDHSPGAIKVAIRNLNDAGLGNVKIEIADFKNYHHKFEGGTVIINPPYDERLAVGNIKELYKSIGDCWKQQYKGFNCWMISSSPDGIKSVGLRPSKKIDVRNGSLDCKFLGYEVYAGSKKAKYNKQ